MEPNRPKTPGKMRKFVEDRAQFRKEAMESLAAIDERDLVGMFGMLAGELVNRQRESELDIIRCERFHTDNLENLNRHKEQLAAYTRRLKASAAMVRLLNLYGGSERLKAAIDAWADATSAEVKFREG